MKTYFDKAWKKWKLVVFIHVILLILMGRLDDDTLKYNIIKI